MPTPLAQATRLVASIEAAQRTGQGDIRSNEVVEKLLVIARMWIAERTAPPLFVAAQPPAFLDAGIHDVARLTVRPRGGVGQPHREMASLGERTQDV